MATHYVSLARDIEPGPNLEPGSASYGTVADGNNSALVTTGHNDVFYIVTTGVCRVGVRTSGDTTALDTGEGLALASGTSIKLNVKGVGKTVRIETV